MTDLARIPTGNDHLSDAEIDADLRDAAHRAADVEADGLLRLPGGSVIRETSLVCTECGEPFTGSRLVLQGLGRAFEPIRSTVCPPCQRDIDKADAEREAFERRGKTAALLARIPAHFAGAHVDHPPAERWVRGLLAGSRRSLLLDGKVGRGKTWQAWGIWRAISESQPDSRLVWWTVTELLAELMPVPMAEQGQQRAILRAAKSADVLFLDDLGLAKPSDWALDRLADVIDHRFARDLPVVATTNLPNEDQAAPRIGERVVSRLLEMSESIHLTGPDRRRRS